MPQISNFWPMASYNSTSYMRTTLEIVLIDKFIVPEESKARFPEEVHKSAFLRTLARICGRLRQ
jgi:hypothetical protein